MLLQRLIALGAENERTEADAICAARGVLGEPNPLPKLVSAAADNLRGRANSAFDAWQAAWSAGEDRLKPDPAWAQLDAEKRHEIRASRGLRLHEAPDLSTPEKIAGSLHALEHVRFNLTHIRHA